MDTISASQHIGPFDHAIYPCTSQASARINAMVTGIIFVKDKVTKWKHGLFDGIWDTEHTNTYIVVISQISNEQDECF